MPRYFLRVMYEGSAFVGWQRQKNGLSVQEAMEEVFRLQLGTEISLTAAGRTDSGVHALGMVVHADLPEAPASPRDFLHKLNSHLPKGIAVTGLREVKPDAHARFDAYERRYQYRICLRKNPFEWGRAWMLFASPDIALMQSAAADFLGRHDFSAFCSTRSTEQDRFCDVKEVTVKAAGDLLTMHIRADRFLMNMVRTMVGTLVEIGLGKRPANDIPAILESRDRRQAGMKAPAEGLYFMEALYPLKIFRDERWLSLTDT
jgi:tRNA pseudouridine38-40 synthase